MTLTQDDVYNFGLHLIDNILCNSGHALSDFPPMPQPLLDWSNTLHNRLISQQCNYDPTYEAVAAQQFTTSLNNNQ